MFLNQKDLAVYKHGVKFFQKIINEIRCRFCRIFFF